MVNAWSLAASVLDGTLDEDYPIMTKEVVDGHGDVHETKITPRESDEYDIPHSDSYYDYTRNDPDAKNPFTVPYDYLKGESVTGKTPWIYESPDGGTTIYRYERGTDPLKRELYIPENIEISTDGGVKTYPVSEDYYPYEQTFLADNDDNSAHHFAESFTLNTEGQTKETMTDSRNKYHEDEILNDIKEYVSSTYNGHYTGTKHEFRNVQTLDLMASRDLASDFCQANILKYGSRYGSKDGRNKKDLLKVIHYAMLLLHFDEHYGKPKMTSGNIDHNMP